MKQGQLSMFLPPRQGWRQDFAIKVTLTLSRLHPQYSIRWLVSMLGTNCPASSSCPSKLSQASSSSALRWPMGRSLVVYSTCLLLEVLVSQITKSAPIFRFPNHPPLFCIFSAACLRKGRGRLGLSVIFCHLSGSCANNHKNLIPDWKL